MRLLLLSGIGGAGTSTIARATAHHAVADGARVRLIDLGNVRETAAARTAAHQWLGALAADILVLREAEEILAEELAVLPGLDEFLALAAIAESAAEPDVDLVIVDAGPIRALFALLSAVDTLELLTASLMTPVLAAARDDLDSPLVQMRDELSTIRECLSGADTAARLCCLPEERSVTELTDALLVTSLHGIDVDLVYVNQVPRKKDAWPKRWAADRRRMTKVIISALEDVPARTLPLRASAVDLETRMRVVDKGAPAWARHVEHAPESIESVGEGFAWNIPARIPDEGQARVGRSGDRLILEIAGITRVRTLPSVLRRCTITHAIATPECLRVELVPDPSVWRGDGS